MKEIITCNEVENRLVNTMNSRPTIDEAVHNINNGLKAINDSVKNLNEAIEEFNSNSKPSETKHLKVNDVADYLNNDRPELIEDAESVLESLGIHVKDENGYRDFWNVLQNIAICWDYYSAIEKAAIAAAFAGNYRGAFHTVMSFNRN